MITAYRSEMLFKINIIENRQSLFVVNLKLQFKKKKLKINLRFVVRRQNEEKLNSCGGLQANMSNSIM